MILSLHNLEEKLWSYFSEQVSEASDGQRWILNPFLDMSVQLANLTTKMKERILLLTACLKCNLIRRRLTFSGWRANPKLAREAWNY
jgi:hypothetical protein